MSVRQLRRALPGILGVVLAGCAFLELDLPHPLSGGDIYVGEDAATITVTTEQVGCCYIEGSLRFARLDGPSSFDWAVDDGSGGERFVDDRLLVGVQASSVKPGDYTLTAWERTCGGNCDNLDPAQGECTLDFTAEPGQAVEILVTYTIPEPCVAEITS
jgi:hypothetical protein